MWYAVLIAIAILPRALHCTWIGVSWMFAVSSSVVIADHGIQGIEEESRKLQRL